MSHVPPIERSRPIQVGSERAMLESMLDFYRATVVNKVAGLTDAQAFTAAVSPSTLTPATVVKHLAGTERFWFSIDFADLDVPWPWTDDDLHSNFRIEHGDTLATVVADYVEECARSRRAVAGARLDDAARGEGMDFTLRYAMIHMIQETARHCGHLDLLRERTDGAVGM
ncbi:DinB family protein [Nocardioides iriomotensis]|uniref:DinB family protein n=1 Tax=Nocardioides iriomotensis TaxID=715784 RepID=A0A4V1Z2T8_9ACTN|nr:DinB family protein [Nocardioides iriomotensis]RYU15556.1 DinB family protein [Nocardioides iriomotensis]